MLPVLDASEVAEEPSITLLCKDRRIEKSVATIAHVSINNIIRQSRSHTMAGLFPIMILFSIEI